MNAKNTGEKLYHVFGLKKLLRHKADWPMFSFFCFGAGLAAGAVGYFTATKPDVHLDMNLNHSFRALEVKDDHLVKFYSPNKDKYLPTDPAILELRKEIGSATRMQ